MIATFSYYLFITYYREITVSKMITNMYIESESKLLASGDDYWQHVLLVSLVDHPNPVLVD